MKHDNNRLNYVLYRCRNVRNDIWMEGCPVFNQPVSVPLQRQNHCASVPQQQRELPKEELAEAAYAPRLDCIDTLAYKTDASRLNPKNTPYYGNFTDALTVNLPILVCMYVQIYK